MGGIFNSPSTPTGTKDTSKDEAEAAAQEKLRANAAGRQSLLVNGGSGVTGEANTSSTLLSGLKSKLGE